MKPLSPSLPHIIAMVGAPGSGKTQFAVEFAKIFNSPVVSSRQFEVFTDNTKTISDATLSLLEEFLKTKQTVIWTDQRISARIVCVSIALPENMDIKSYLFGCKPIPPQPNIAG